MYRTLGSSLLRRLNGFVDYFLSDFDLGLDVCRSSLRRLVNSYKVRVILCV